MIWPKNLRQTAVKLVMFWTFRRKNIRSAFSYIADKHSLSPNIVLYFYIDSKEIKYGPLSTIIVTISIYLSVTIFTNKNIVYYRFALLFSPSSKSSLLCVFFQSSCVYIIWLFVAAAVAAGLYKLSSFY